VRRVGVSCVMGRRRLAIMGSREEAPSMYEMEGASQSRGSTVRSLGPRICGTSPPSPGGAWANSGRLGARLPRRRLPGGGSPGGWTRRELRAPGARLRELPVLWCSLTLGFPPDPGHRLWWRAKFLPPPKELRKRPEEPFFKILCDGAAHPQRRLCYPQAGARCPPVVPQFIHTRAHTGPAQPDGGGARWLRQWGVRRTPSQRRA
jgi:hypothetical protein